MKHLREFIKMLGENDHSGSHPQEKVITITPDADGYGDLELKVKFTHTKGGSDRHGDGPESDEYHDDELDVLTAVLNKAIEFTDESGEVQKFEAGTDVVDLPGWGEKDDEIIIHSMAD